MAEEPIRKEDIIDSTGIIEALQEIIKLLKVDLVTALEAVKKANPSTTEGQQAIQNKSDQITEIIPKIKEVSDIEAEYKRRVDALNLATDKSTKEFSAEARELLKVGKALDSSNKKTENYAKGSLTDLEKRLSALKKAWRDVGSASGASTKDIEKLDAQVKKLNASIGNHQKNVGNYKTAVKGVGSSIVEAGKSLFAFGGVAGAVTSIWGKFVSTLKETELGANVIGKLRQASKTFFQSIISGQALEPLKVLSIAIKDAGKAIKIAEQFEVIRKGERTDLVKIAELENAVKVARYKSVDAMTEESEQIKWLNIAMAKEDELLKYNIADKEEELKAIQDLLKVKSRAKDTQLLDMEAQKLAEIASLTGEKNFRIMSRASALKEKEEKKRLKALEEEKEAIMFKDLTEVNGIDAVIIKKKELNEINIKSSEDYIRKNEELAESIARTKALELEHQQERLENITQYLELSSQAINVIADVIEGAKQRELSAAGDNAKERERIEREYYKKQKMMSISQAIISGAIGIVKSFELLPPLNFINAAIVAATTAAQVAIIAAQKFAEGGEIFGKSHAQGGTMIEAERGEYVVKKESTSKYKKLIEAINDDNPMRIAEEIRNRNFHTVWGGVSTQLSQVSKQDPYTRMMYELMKNDIKTYIDSNGDTVLSYPNGTKRVIRKYTA